MSDFEDLLGRLRLGEQSAVSEFVREYEPFIRRAMRSRLARANLRPAADSADLCQSVLRVFLVRVMAGDYELGSTQDLERLLFGIARKKFAMLVRHEFAERRDRNRSVPLLPEHEDRAGPVSLPGEAATQADLLEQIGLGLAEGDRRLFLLRRQGKSWDEIATELNASAVTLRKRLSRVLRHMAMEFGGGSDEQRG